jgi:predicted CXXCH cytochrome family protein
MKKVFAIVVAVLFVVAAAAIAGDSRTLQSKTGDVTFNHKIHGETAGCKACHTEETPAKLTLNKDSAHKLCKGCHETKGKGPTKCLDCHKKK